MAKTGKKFMSNLAFDNRDLHGLCPVSVLCLVMREESNNPNNKHKRMDFFHQHRPVCLVVPLLGTCVSGTVSVLGIN